MTTPSNTRLEKTAEMSTVKRLTLIAAAAATGAATLLSGAVTEVLAVSVRFIELSSGRANSATSDLARPDKRSL